VSKYIYTPSVVIFFDTVLCWCSKEGRIRVTRIPLTADKRAVNLTLCGEKKNTINMNEK
jgi:hypothetical protein